MDERKWLNPIGTAFWTWPVVVSVADKRLFQFSDPLWLVFVKSTIGFALWLALLTTIMWRTK